MARISIALLMAVGASCASEPRVAEVAADVDQENPEDGGDTTCNDPLAWSRGTTLTMSSASGGVVFDLNGDGVAHRVAWPSGGWLALDLNGDGLITSGRELFGAATKTPANAPGGLASLGAYDEDGNHFIDARDSVFPRLRVWEDKNRNGVSEPGELYSMADLGVLAIGTEFSADYPATIDANGNRFQGAAVVMLTNSDEVMTLWGVIPGNRAGGAATNADVCRAPDPSQPLWRCYASCYFRMKFFLEQAAATTYDMCGGYGRPNPDGSVPADALAWGTFYGDTEPPELTKEAAIGSAYAGCVLNAVEQKTTYILDNLCEPCDRYGVWSSRGGNQPYRITGCNRVYLH